MSVLLAEPIAVNLIDERLSLLFPTVKFQAPIKLLVVPAVTFVPIEEDAMVRVAKLGLETVVTVKMLPLIGNDPASATVTLLVSQEVMSVAEFNEKLTVFPAERPAAGSIDKANVLDCPAFTVKFKLAKSTTPAEIELYWART